MMKQYINDNRLMISGKAKHVKMTLNGLAKSPYGSYTLTQYTELRPAMQITIGKSLLED